MPVLTLLLFTASCLASSKESVYSQRVPTSQAVKGPSSTQHATCMEGNPRDVTLTLKSTLHAQLVRWSLPCSSTRTGNRLMCCSPTGILPVHIFKSTFNASRELLPSVREGYKTQSQNICSVCSDICCTKQETGFHHKLE